VEAVVVDLVHTLVLMVVLVVEVLIMQQLEDLVIYLHQLLPKEIMVV
jgi:hypothetical protein